jgi:hypothetical protein
MASNSHDTDTENEDEGGDDEGNAKFARNCSVFHPASTCEPLDRDELLGGIAIFTCVVNAARPTVVTLTAEQTFVGRAAKVSPTYSPGRGGRQLRHISSCSGEPCRRHRIR